jgi:hypothetical protein
VGKFWLATVREYTQPGCNPSAAQAEIAPAAKVVQLVQERDIELEVGD